VATFRFFFGLTDVLYFRPKAKRVWDDAGPTKEEMESLDKTPDKGKEVCKRVIRKR